MQQNHEAPAGRLLTGAAALLLTVLFAGCASVGPSPEAAADATPVAAATAAADARKAAEAAAEAAARAQREAAAAQAAAAAAVPPPQPQKRPEAVGSLWDRIRDGFAMPEMDTPLVAEKERFYLSKPEYLQRMFARGGRYLYYIVEEIERRGMPTELALLPFVESAMNPVALSHAQAAGLWQFIPSTGKAYDLQQNWWVDNRRDVVKSTNAALDYLQKIYAMQGNDWFLALASYNWGEGAVQRAMKKNAARGKPTDYLSLDMPAETRHYVPKLIALKHILLRANELGVALPALPNKPYFVTIEKTRPIDLKLAAQFAGMNVDEFVALNPAHNRPVIAASKNNQIRLPADRVDGFLNAVEQHERARKTFASWQPYTLKPGETIDTLASANGVQAAEIRRANGLRDGQRIVAGTRLLAPHKVVEDEMKVESFVAPRVYEQVDKPAVYHTVGAKESLGSIAKRYGVSAATLAAWNNVKQGVKRGMRLLVQPASTQTLLTDEEGDRSVVASSPKGGIVHAVMRPERDGEPYGAPAVRKVSDTPQPSASAPGRRAVQPAARATASSRPKAAARSVAASDSRRPASRAPSARAFGSTPRIR